MKNKNKCAAETHERAATVLGLKMGAIKKLSMVISVIVVVMMVVPAAVVVSTLSTSVGTSDKGILDDEWYLDLNPLQGWGWLGVTPGIVNLQGVNTYGSEPCSDLEIVTGSDGYYSHVNPVSSASGLWRAIDSRGNVEWYRDTLSDESRGAIAITDLNQDGVVDLIGGTTSGRTIEAMDRFGNFVWTFPHPPTIGNFEWPTGVAVADLNPNISGLEVVAIRRSTCHVVVLDGDNTDGLNEGIFFTDFGDGISWEGIEGIHWDVLWKYNMGGWDCRSSAAIGDVDNDGVLEVVVGSNGGNVFVFDGVSGMLETTFTTGAIQASPALANLDADARLEIVIGDLNGILYVFEWDGINGNTQCFLNLDSAIYSSAAIGNIDVDSRLEIVVGTIGGRVYALTGECSQEWVYPSTGSAGSFYASPSLADRVSVSPYDIEWQMFRRNAMRTGYYENAANPLDVYIGSTDGYLYLLNGDNGVMIDRFRSSGPIRGSPVVGDIDGDGKLNIIFQSWGGHYTTMDRLWNIEDNAVGDEIKTTNVTVNNTIPFIEWKWELYDANNLTNETEIIGIHGKNTTVIICAIACDNNSVKDIANVKAYVFYPDGTLKDYKYLNKTSPFIGPCWNTIPSWDYDHFLWKWNISLCDIYEGNITMYGGDMMGLGKDPEGVYTVIVKVNDTSGAHGNMTNYFNYSYKNVSPFIEWKWELPDEDNFTNGTQVYPIPGGNKTVIKCVIACDPNGVADIVSVEAKVYYPNGTLKGHDYLQLASNDSICRQTIPPEDTEFWDKYKHGICEVYEGNITMEFWEQPGDYLVVVKVNDTQGYYSYMNNTFEYMPCIAIDNDASFIDFGLVIPGSLSQVAGDNDMATLNAPTIRNICNVPVNISINGTPLLCKTPETCGSAIIPVPTTGFSVGVYDLPIPGVYGAPTLPIMPGPMSTNLENFQLNIPLGTLPGNYQGKVTVAGIQG